VLQVIFKNQATGLWCRVARMTTSRQGILCDQLQNQQVRAEPGLPRLPPAASPRKPTSRRAATAVAAR
jgi:hypothetical protein